jgi:hypothetical protein
MFKELNGKRMCSSPQCLCREKTNTKSIKTFRDERVIYSQVLVFVTFLGT